MQENTLYTTKMVLDKLKISRATLHNLRKSGKIGVVKIGDSVRFTPQEIDRFISANTTTSSN